MGRHMRTGGRPKLTNNEFPNAFSMVIYFFSGESIREHGGADVNAHPALCRLLNAGTRRPAASEAGSTASAWHRGAASAMTFAAGAAAKKMREAARLKELQRTPFPMVLSRIKVLLERIHKFQAVVSAAHQPSIDLNRAGSGLLRSPSSDMRSMKSAGGGGGGPPAGGALGAIYGRMGGTTPEPGMMTDANILQHSRSRIRASSPSMKSISGMR